MRLTWRAGLLLALAFGAGAQARAQAQVSVRDDRGSTQAWTTPPARIVSLLPSITESLCALGGCARLVGTDSFSNAPASVLALPKLGGLDDALLEAIVALQPDVVLASSAARVTERLAALGLKVVLLKSETHADVQRSLHTLARLLGTPDAALAVSARIERELREAALRVPAGLRGRRVYFEVASTPYAAGAASFIGETLARLGMGNAVPAELGPFPKLNPEFVVRAQPDIVMAGQRNLAEMPQRPGWQALRALRRRQTCGFDPEHYELLVRPGPRLGEAAALIAQCLAALPALAEVR